MADTLIIVDAQGNEHEFPEGMDPKKAAAIVRKATGLPELPPETTGFLDTTKEIVKGAARRFLPSTLSGAASAVMALPKAAYNAVTSAPSAVGDIVSDPGAAASRLGTNAKGMIRSLAEWPGNVIEDVKAGATDPKAYGESVGESLGAGTGAALAGKYIPIAPKPVMKTVGKGLQYAGEHPFAARMAGGAGVVSGLYKGDPALVLAGAAGMAAPTVMTKAGQGMRIAAGESPAVVKLGEEGVAQLDDQFNNAVGRRNSRLNDRDALRADKAAAAATKAAEEADRAAAAEAKKAGTTPKTRYSETVSGTDAEGTKKTAVTTYTPEGDSGPKTSLNPVEQEMLKRINANNARLDARGVPVKKATAQYSPVEDLATPSAQAAQERLAAQARPTVQAMADEGAFAGDRTNNVTPSAQEANNAAMRAEAPPAMPFADRTPEERLLARGGPMNPTPESPVDAELASRLPVESVPASRTSREMSATAGLSREDALALGLNPDNPITKLPPDAIAWLLKQRQARQGAYRANAGMDSIATALADREQ